MRAVGEGRGVMRRWRGTSRERKKSSSFVGPAMKLRQPIQLLKVSWRSCPLIQSRVPESMMPLSKRGPAKRRAVSNNDFSVSRGEIGYQPRW